MLARWTRQGRHLGHRLARAVAVEEARGRGVGGGGGGVMAEDVSSGEREGSTRPWWRRPTLVTTRTVGTNAGSGEASSSGVDERAAVEAKARVQSSVLATFGSWFAQRGGEIHASVRMVYRPGAGWALEADGEIPSGERLVFLPTALTLGCGTNVVSEPLRRVVETVPDEFWSSRLGLVLLRERVAGQHSPFAPYINLLPSVHEGSPTFYPPDAIRELQYAPLISQVARRGKFLASFAGKGLTIDDGADYVNESHPERRRVEMTIDANALGWASVCASSRAFKMFGRTPLLFPVIDVCNHSFEPSAKVQSVDGGVELVTTRHLKAGEPIELSYGNLSNDELLLDYGFIVENNPFDSVKLRWDLKLIHLAREIGGLATAPIGAAVVEKDGVHSASPASGDDAEIPLTSWQKAAMERIGLGANDELRVRPSGEVMDKKALAALRVLYSKSPAEASRAADAPYGVLNTEVVSRDTEVKALRTAMSLAALATGNFPTNLAQDHEILRSAKSPQAALAIRFRMEKKKVLRDCMSQLNKAIERAVASA